MPAGCRCDRIVAITRSGMTTEVLALLRQVRGSVPTVAVVILFAVIEKHLVGGLTAGSIT